jgi:hypothetical protein
MIKLVFDLECGFKESLITRKDEEWDLSGTLEADKAFIEENWEEIKEDLDCTLEEVLADPMLTEAGFYEAYKDDIDGLLERLKSTGEFDMLYESSVLDVAHTHFEDILRKQKVCPGIWEPSNFRLVYEK